MTSASKSRQPRDEDRYKGKRKKGERKEEYEIGQKGCQNCASGEESLGKPTESEIRRGVCISSQKVAFQKKREENEY